MHRGYQIQAQQSPCRLHKQRNSPSHCPVDNSSDDTNKRPVSLASQHATYLCCCLSLCVQVLKMSGGRGKGTMDVCSLFATRQRSRRNAATSFCALTASAMLTSFSSHAGKGGGPKAKAVSRSTKAGLQFPVGRLAR